MSVTNPNLPLEALQLYRALDSEVVTPAGTTYGSVQELHAFLDRLERRPLTPVQDDESDLDAALAKVGRSTSRAARRAPLARTLPSESAAAAP